MIFPYKMISLGPTLNKALKNNLPRLFFADVSFGDFHVHQLGAKGVHSYFSGFNFPHLF